MRATNKGQPSKILAITRRLKPEFTGSPQKTLMLKIVLQAVTDMTAEPPTSPKSTSKYWKSQHKNNMQTWLDTKIEAEQYIQHDLIHAIVVGVDPEWVRDTIFRILTWKGSIT